MSKLFKTAIIGVLLVIGASNFAAASPLVYRPINPSFGGDPLNGNWLLASGQAQTSGASDSPGFSIDFPDFGDLGQDGNTDPSTLPQTNTQNTQTQTN